jgi:hypothetical protein
VPPDSVGDRLLDPSDGSITLADIYIYIYIYSRATGLVNGRSVGVARPAYAPTAAV